MPCYRIFCTPFYGPPAKAAVIQFDNAQSIAVDGSGNVFAIDLGSERIEKFNSDGNYLTQWGSSGSGSGQFFNPQGLAIDESGNVYVTDAGNDRIQKFDPANNNVAVPTVTEWGMILFMILAGLVSLYYLKRIKRALEK